MNEASTDSAPDLAIGDAVSWCHSSAKGKSISFSTRVGKITAINRESGMACAKMRNGRTQWLRLHRFRLHGEKTELTEAVEEMAKEAASKLQPGKEAADGEPS